MFRYISTNIEKYEGVSKSFRTGLLERKLQMVQVQLYRYFVSQSSAVCHHNPLCCFSTIVYYCRLFRYNSVRKLLDTQPYIMYLSFSLSVRVSIHLQHVT